MTLTPQEHALLTAMLENQALDDDQWTQLEAMGLPILMPRDARVIARQMLSYATIEMPT